MDTLPKTGYMRPSQVIRHFQICESTLWNWVRKGAFPQPEKLSDGVSRFNVSEIRAWVQSKKDKSGNKKIK